MKRPDYLKPSTWLQLQALLGVLIVMVPATLLASQLPPCRDWPLWVLIAVPTVLGAVCMAWFRQCMSPDGTSVKPKWW